MKELGEAVLLAVILAITWLPFCSAQTRSYIYEALGILSVFVVPIFLDSWLLFVLAAFSVFGLILLIRAVRKR